jgi:ABC-2 type transport system ATP-binding protein
MAPVAGRAPGCRRCTVPAVDAIRTEALSKHYGRGRVGPLSAGPRIAALQELTISVREGEIFGFLGPNGAGKSTMIRLLLGFLHSTAGRAEVLGLDCARASVVIRGRVGYLPGGIALYDGLTGEDLLDYLGQLYPRPPVRRAELVDRLELSARTLKRTVRDYSRGMRQKIGIVQALQHDPELAILDEPTEGLDPLMQRAFYEILDDLRRAGRTIFFSSHILSEVERVCDRVAIIRSGRLVALEDVAALLARRKRHVELRVRGALPDLGSIPGVAGVIARDGTVAFSLEGDIGPFVRALSGTDVADLTIEPARLEEAFLELYEGENGTDDGNRIGDADAAARAAPAR